MSYGRSHSHSAGSGLALNQSSAEAAGFQKKNRLVQIKGKNKHRKQQMHQFKMQQE
jgi:hypothetical protein